MLTLTNRIDMYPGAVPLTIHVGQYDSDFALEFELYSSAGEFTLETGTTAMIRGTKTDGNGYDADAAIDIAGKLVTVSGDQQMTAAAGRNRFELVLLKNSKVLTTANFILNVERAAMDADTIASESVLKELNAIIESAATATEAAETATVAAGRAEAAAEVAEGLSSEARAALLACFSKVAWTDQSGQDLYDALEAALYSGGATLTATFTQGGSKFYPFSALDDLRDNLVVTYTDAQGVSIVISNYVLSGQLEKGSSRVTVTYAGAVTYFYATVEDVEIVNNESISGGFYNVGLTYYARKSTGNTARCRFNLPIKNHNYTISVVDSAKYSIASYNMASDVAQSFTIGDVAYNDLFERESNAAVAWGTEFTYTSPYVWCAFKKNDGTDFTIEEIENAYGTIYTVS